MNLLGRLLTFGNVSLDTDGRQVFVGGAPRAFPARETAVLEILLATKAGLPDEWNAYRTKTKGGRT